MIFLRFCQFWNNNKSRQHNLVININLQKGKNVKKNILIVTSVAIIFSGCATSSYTKLDELNKVTVKECTKPTKNKSAWHIDNLYDCESNTFFIPYQLWSGAEFDGNKKTSKSHQVNNTGFATYNSSTKPKPVHIKGTIKYINKETNKENSVYVRKNESKGISKTQYFVANDMGIGRVYDDREGGRTFNGKGIKFPAGFGWQLGKRRLATDIENGSERTTEIEITKMSFNDKQELKSITFKWWSNGNLDHSYTYTVNNGLSYSLRL